MPTPAERFAAARAGSGLRQQSELAAFARRSGLPARRLPGAGLRRRSRPAAGCSSRRRPAPARRSSASSPSTSRWPPGARLLHDADQGAVEPEVRRPRRAATAPTRSACSPATTSINGEAPVVVMTTEVLRNMLYAGSPTLPGLGYVVMDEVHYLADRFRGAVWEEVIIHLPESVRAGLAVGDGVATPRSSATGWTTVRGDTEVDRRGAPAGAAVAARAGRATGCSTCSTRRDDGAGDRARSTPSSLRLARDDCAAPARDRRPRRGRSARGPTAARRGNGRASGRPSRADVVERLDARGPAAGDHLHLQPGRLRRRRRSSACAPACG